MSILLLQRSLERPDPSLIFRTGDPDDPRVGDVLVDLADVGEGAGMIVALLGVPQHIGVERNGGRPGADAAPDAIRAALTRCATSGILDVVRSGRLVVTDLGNIDTDGKTLEQIHDEQHDVIVQCLERGIVPVILGGGHDCAWPSVRAFETVGRAYGVINIDAHADVRPLKEGRAHSGSPFRQLLDHQPGALIPGGFVEFGLQSASVALAHLQVVRAAGMSVQMLDDIRAAGVVHAWNDAYANAARSGRLHISLDMDAFASAYAPGVSAPSADGFAPHEIRACLRAAASAGHVAALDVVECAPTYDVDGRTAKLAATMIMEILHGFATFLRG
jgi:formiminoglutamase